jgi:RNA polymerase sigma-70 factor, ECF subfamily
MATARIVEHHPVTAGNERDLVRRARAGDVAAFETLYRATVSRVYALCLRMVGNVHLAEELTQESFLRAWQRLASFRGDSAFSTWMHRVAVNVVLGHQRRPSWRRETSSETALEAVPSAVSVAGAVDLERAIAGLPRRARQVFVLHDIEGYTHDEIATAAAMAVGTSKAQLSRARRLLRKALTR